MASSRSWDFRLLVRREKYVLCINLYSISVTLQNQRGHNQTEFIVEVGFCGIIKFCRACEQCCEVGLLRNLYRAINFIKMSLT